MPKLSWDAEFTSKAVSSCFPGTLTPFWFLLGTPEEALNRINLRQEILPCVLPRGLRIFIEVTRQSWICIEYEQLSKWPMWTRIAAILALTSVFSLLKMKSSPFFMWDPGQKEVWRRAEKDISLNSALLLIANSSSISSLDTAGYRNEFV